jgi:hypothetical protein
MVDWREFAPERGEQCSTREGSEGEHERKP